MDGLLAARALRTDRLAAAQGQAALMTGGEGGARLLDHLGMPASPDTLLRLVKRMPGACRRGLRRPGRWQTDGTCSMMPCRSPCVGSPGRMRGSGGFHHSPERPSRAHSARERFHAAGVTPPLVPRAVCIAWRFMKRSAAGEPLLTISHRMGLARGTVRRYALAETPFHNG